VPLGEGDGADGEGEALGERVGDGVGEGVGLGGTEGTMMLGPGVDPRSASRIKPTS
jgi:hypothetical protein